MVGEKMNPFWLPPPLLLARGRLLSSAFGVDPPITTRIALNRAIPSLFVSRVSRQAASQ